MASDQLVIVFLGVYDPGQHELMLIREADAACRLSSDPVQGGYQDTHQQGNDRNDHQQLNECETVSSFHTGTSHKSIVTAHSYFNRIGRYTQHPSSGNKAIFETLAIYRNSILELVS